MHTLVLSTGSNLGNRRENLVSAIGLIEEKLGPILKVSGIYESGAWGYDSKNRYHNQCLLVETDSGTEDCLRKIVEIELILGRERSGSGYSDRIIDIDILFFDTLVMDTGSLKIPHERLALRKFVLLPLAEILPDFEHPVLHKTCRELLEQCPDTGEVVLLKLKQEGRNSWGR